MCSLIYSEIKYYPKENKGNWGVDYYNLWPYYHHAKIGLNQKPSSWDHLLLHWFVTLHMWREYDGLGFWWRKSGHLEWVFGFCAYFYYSLVLETSIWMRWQVCNYLLTGCLQSLVGVDHCETFSFQFVMNKEQNGRKCEHTCWHVFDNPILRKMHD
jgi:hypothetical protein